MKYYKISKNLFFFIKISFIFILTLFTWQNSLAQISFSNEYDEIKKVNNNIYLVRIASKWGIVDKENNNKIPIKYKSIVLNKYIWKYILQSPNGKYGFSDISFNKIIPNLYDSITFLQTPNRNYIQCWKNDTSLIYNQQSKYLFTNNSKDIVAISGHPNHYLVKDSNSKWGLINSEKIKIPFLYDTLSYGYFIPENRRKKKKEVLLFIAKTGNHYGLINDENVVKLNFKFRNLKVLSPKTFIVRTQNHYGVINDEEKIIIPEKYELIEHFNYKDGKGPYLKVVNNKNKAGIFNKNGKLKIEMEYQAESFKLSNKTPGYSIEAIKDSNSYVFTSLNDFEPANFVNKESIGGNQMTGVYIYTQKNGTKCIIGGDPNKLCNNSYECFDGFKRIKKKNKEFLILKTKQKYGNYKYGIRECWKGKCLSSIIFDELNFEITKEQVKYFNPRSNEIIIAVGYIAKNNSSWIISNYGLKEIKQ